MAIEGAQTRGGIPGFAVVGQLKMCVSLFASLLHFIHSQSLATLSYVEKILTQCQVPVPHPIPGSHSSSQGGEKIHFSGSKWVKNKNFCRELGGWEGGREGGRLQPLMSLYAGLDGSTSSFERDRLINHFNSPGNTECWVFLLSTK